MDTTSRSGDPFKPSFTFYGKACVGLTLVSDQIILTSDKEACIMCNTQFSGPLIEYFADTLCLGGPVCINCLSLP